MAVAAFTAVVSGLEASTAGLEAFTAVAEFMLVGAIAMEVRAQHIPSRAAQGVLDIQLPVVQVGRGIQSQGARVTTQATMAVDMVRQR